jgi:hypothetical protein
VLALHPHCLCQSALSEADGLHEFLHEDFADGGLRFVINIASPVTVVVEIDTGSLHRGCRPLEDKPPLTFDADRMKPLQPAAQLLENGCWAARANFYRSWRRRALKLAEKRTECSASGCHQ